MPLSPRFPNRTKLALLPRMPAPWPRCRSRVATGGAAAARRLFGGARIPARRKRRSGPRHPYCARRASRRHGRRLGQLPRRDHGLAGKVLRRCDHPPASPLRRLQQPLRAHAAARPAARDDPPGRREQGLLTAEGNPDHVGGPGRLRALRVQAAHNSSVRGHPRQRHKWQPHGIGREVDFPHRRRPMTAGPAGRHARQSPGSGNTTALAKARLLPVQRPRPGGYECHDPVAGLPVPLRVLCRLTSGKCHRAVRLAIVGTGHENGRCGLLGVFATAAPRMSVAGGTVPGMPTQPGSGDSSPDRLLPPGRKPPGGQPTPHDSVFRRIFGVPENMASQLRAVLPPGLAARLDLGLLAQVPAQLRRRGAEVAVLGPAVHRAARRPGRLRLSAGRASEQRRPADGLPHAAVRDPDLGPAPARPPPGPAAAGGDPAGGPPRLRSVGRAGATAGR